MWALNDDLTVRDAAALVAGVDPTCVEYDQDEPSHFRDPVSNLTSNGPAIVTVKAALKGITTAINSGKLKATIRRDAWVTGWGGEDEDYEQEQPSYLRTKSIKLDEGDGWPDSERLKVKVQGITYRASPNWALTTVDREDLIGWLRSRGYAKGYLFPDNKPTGVPDYLDPKNPRYAAKLEAAVKVWLAMEDENLRRGRTPAQAMIAWLESRYAQFGLIHKQSGKNSNGETTYKIGERNDGAIKEVAKVANWESDGGAPKTPG